MENSGDAIFGSTTDGLVTSWNAGAQRLFGYEREDLVGKSFAVLAMSGRIPTERSQRLVSGGPTERWEAICRRKDGSLVDVLITASPSLDQTGAVTGLSIIAQDISERIAARQALEASGRRLAEAQRISGIGSFEADPVTSEMTWSEQHYRVLGIDPALPPSAALFMSVIHPDDMAGLVQAWNSAADTGESVDYTFRIDRADSGEKRTIKARFQRVVGADGVVSLAGT